MPHPKRVKREVRLENHPKTSAPLLLTFRYARPPPTINVGIKPYQGRPVLSAFINILGAIPRDAKPIVVREPA